MRPLFPLFQGFCNIGSFIPCDFNLIHNFISLYLVKGMWYLCLSQGLCSMPVIFHSLWCLPQKFFKPFFILFSFIMQEIVAMLSLRPGQTVLDVGCGIGGSAFYMVKV